MVFNKVVYSFVAIEPYIFSKVHDTIQRLNFVVHTLNMIMKKKSVEIIDLQLCSSLKLDGV